MYSAHYHLLLNHWPILGTFIGLVLFVVALYADKEDLKQAGLAMFALMALLALPAYMSGSAAQEVIKNSPDVSKAMIENHQGVALLALIFMGITGLASLVGLWSYSRASKTAGAGTPRLGSGVAVVVLLLSIATMGLMSVTGNTGGNIRHPEIVDKGAALSSLGNLGGRIVPVIKYIVVDYSMWVWPILEDLHFFGLILIIGAVGILNLRIMGFFKRLPVGPLHRFIPWGIAGFIINVITGMMFYMGMPGFYANNPAYKLKMLVILIAGANLLFFYCTSAFRPLEKLGPGDDAPISAKLVALSSIVLWIFVIVLGRYLPFYEVLQ